MLLYELAVGFEVSTLCHIKLKQWPAALIPVDKWHSCSEGSGESGILCGTVCGRLACVGTGGVCELDLWLCVSAFATPTSD